MHRHEQREGEERKGRGGERERREEGKGRGEGERRGEGRTWEELTMNIESCILMRSSMTLHTLLSSSGSCFCT